MRGSMFTANWLYPICLLWLCSFTGPTWLDAQLPEASKQLVVRIHPVFAITDRIDTTTVVDDRPIGTFPTDTTRSRGTGTGFVIAYNEDRVLIATAAHNLRKAIRATGETLTPEAISVAFASLGADSSPVALAAASIDVHEIEGLDLALVSVDMDRVPVGLLPFSLDRQGTARERDRVIPLGCAYAEVGVGCWTEPGFPDVVATVDAVEVRFFTTLTKRGHSGGALFNVEGEIVGMITRIDPPFGIATRIDVLLQAIHARGEGYAFNRRSTTKMRQSTVPRGGHDWTVGASWLWTRAQAGLTFPAGVPLEVERRDLSGRITFEKKLSQQGPWSRLHWQISGLRLAPGDLAVHAAMVGVQLRTGGPIGDMLGGEGLLSDLGLGLSVFGEMGLGRVEARWDEGGYFVEDPATGTVLYEPQWGRDEDDGLVAGLGARLELVVKRWLVVDVMVANWYYRRPDRAPEAPGYLWGAGVRTHWD